MKIKDSIPTFIFILFLIGCLIYSYIVPMPTVIEEKELKKDLIVPTLITKLNDNAVWACTFNLLWNDLKSVNNGDIIFEEDNIMAKELNQETFTTSSLSEDSYYIKHGYMTNSLKKEIEKSIQEKFNEKSSVLDKFTFSDNSKDYFFYAMLVKNFKFLKPFDILSSDTFGINETSDNELRENVKVLYYKDNTHYAVSLKTKEDSEIILAKGLEGNNFKELYDSINLENEEEFLDNDIITISNFNFKIQKDFNELENKKFTLNNEPVFIKKAIQIIEFKLDNTGGKVKSEASLDVNKSTYEGRYFDFKDNFTMFIKEKDLPYFAIKVDDIEKFK